MKKISLFQKWIIVIGLLGCISFLKGVVILSNTFYYDLYSNIDIVQTWMNLGIIDTLILAYIFLIGFIISIVKTYLKKNNHEGEKNE